MNMLNCNMLMQMLSKSEELSIVFSCVNICGPDDKVL